jgi:hypothetical protein
MVFGLALVLALVLGVATAAMGANGQNLVLGSLNNAATAVTKLTGTVGGGPALRVENPSTAAGSTALELHTSAGKPPMKVNRAAKVANLNADRLDDKDSADFLGKTEKAADAELLDGKDSSAFQQVPTDAQHFTIAGSTMVDRDGLNRSQVYLSGNGGEQYCTKTGGDQGHAAVHLPQGATITAVNADYGDDAATTNGNGVLFVSRNPLVGSNGTADDIFLVKWPDTATAGELASGSETEPYYSAEAAKIDNTKYVYSVNAFPSGGAAICGVDISYTMP